MFLSPLQMVELMPLGAGDKVGDFGFGTGAYTRAIHNKLGREGAVYAFAALGTHIDALHRGCVEGGIEKLYALEGDLNSHIPLDRQRGV